MTRFSQQKLVKSIDTFRSVIAGVQLYYLLVVVSLFFTMIFLKKLMIENFSTLNKTKTVKFHS